MTAREAFEKTVIPLRRPYGILALALVLFAGTAIFFYHRASTNERGLVINGIIHLDLDGADMFYAVMCLLSAGMSVMGGLALWRIARLKEFRVVIGRRSLKLPPSGPPWRPGGEVTVRIEDILTVQMQTGLLLVCEQDRKHAIQARWLPPGWSIQQVAEAIAARMRALRDNKHAADRSGMG